MADSTWPDQYNIVATADVLRGLADIQDLYIEDHGQIQLDDGRWSVTALATSDAIAQVQARGCETTLLKTGAQQEQEANDELASRGGTGGGGVA